MKIRDDVSDLIFNKIIVIFPCLLLLIVAGLFATLLISAWPSMREFGLGFVYKSGWNPVSEKFGALPLIYGTLVSSLVALLIAIPIGLGTAIYLAEYAPWWVRNAVSMLVDLLAAIPSVIYGLWGIFVLVPLMRLHIQPFLAKWLGFLPLFQGSIYGVGMLSAGIILAIMIIPFIVSVSREVILAVPAVYRESAYAMGATRWEAIRTIVLSYGKPGIIGAVILALGRAIGETMAVTMMIGNNPKISASLFAPAYTLASVIANEFAEAVTRLHTSALIELGLVLFAMTLLLNIGARVLVWRVSRTLVTEGR
ncbi:MAG: phosphate ABC transporter permease subunit PstC [Candidatus Omnitrophota bacterium]